MQTAGDICLLERLHQAMGGDGYHELTLGERAASTWDLRRGRRQEGQGIRTKGKGLHSVLITFQPRCSHLQTGADNNFLPWDFPS